MKTAACTGGIGDIVYSIPVLRLLNVTKLYVKENFYVDGRSMYSVTKPLLATQGIEVLPTKGGLPFQEYEPGLQFDYDIDAFREMQNRDTMHIIRNMMLRFRCYKPNWNKPFLFDIPVSDSNYNLIFLSDRWRENSKVNWLELYARIKKPVYFIGLAEDHNNFCVNYGAIQWKCTYDLLEMANLIAGCSNLYTNQSVALTIAQGLGKNYYLELKPRKSNTRFYTRNEHIL